MTIYQNVTQLTGRTPLVRLNRLVHGGAAEVLAKLEFFNPTHSVKDRMQWQWWTPRKSKGCSLQNLSSWSNLRQYRYRAGFHRLRTRLQKRHLMPETVSMERKLLLRALGAELILTPGAEGWPAHMETALQCCVTGQALWLADQFNNPANVDAHRRTTARGNLAGHRRQGGYFVAGVGTGGTITGAGSRLREYNPALRIIAVEPAASPVLSGGKKGPTRCKALARALSPPS
jgi:cysteine synthase A